MKRNVERIQLPVALATVIRDRTRDIAIAAAEDATLRGQSEMMAVARSAYLRGFEDGRQSKPIGDTA